MNLIPFYLLPVCIWLQSHDGPAALGAAAVALGLRTGFVRVARRADLDEALPDEAIRPDLDPPRAFPPTPIPRGGLVFRLAANLGERHFYGPLIGFLMLKTGELFEPWIGAAWKTTLVGAGAFGIVLSVVVTIVHSTLSAPRRTGRPTQ